MSAIESWRQHARAIKRDTYALYLACKDPRVPWYARALAAVVVAYAFSPIDLIPDFIPVLGYLDDLILVPLGIYLTIRLIPPPVLAQARREADAWLAQKQIRPRSYWAAAFIVLVWLAFA